MKSCFFTISLLVALFQIQLLGQQPNVSSSAIYKGINAPYQSGAFEITRIGEHGFCNEGDTLYYKIDLDVKNNTNFKLRKTVLCASINNLWEFQCCSNQIYDSVWIPQSVIKYKLFISNVYPNGDFIRLFDQTPESILLRISINSHNIDKDYDELVSKQSVKDDWKDFQKVLGLRDIEPDERLKIIKPPVKTKTEDTTNSLFSDQSNVPDRRPLNIERPNGKFNKRGTVVVEVTLDREGNVIQAVPGIKGSTTEDEKLYELAKKAALKSRFNANPKAPEHQILTITYNFELN